MAEAGAVVMERHDPTTLQYGAERGPLGLREEIAAYANRSKRMAPPWRRTGWSSRAASLKPSTCCAPS